MLPERSSLQTRQIRIFAHKKIFRASILLFPVPCSLLPVPCCLPLVSRQLAAFPCRRRIICARIQHHLPVSVRLLTPHSDIPPARQNRVPIRILAAPLIVTPRVAHVAGRPHHCVRRRPRQLIILRRPGGRLHDGNLADQG